MTANYDWALPFREELQSSGLQLLGAQSTIDVADLVQQTLLEASLVPPPHAHPAARLAWLREALKNNLRDELRKRKAGKRNTARERPLGSQELAAKGSTPSRRMKQSEELKILLRRLESLPQDQQEAVRLRYIEELSVDGVALRMGKSRAAVAGLIRRGLAGLRDQSGQP